LNITAQEFVMKPLDIHNQLIPILCLGGMLIGLLMPMLLPENKGIKKRSAIVFVFLVVVLFGYWFMKEPDILVTLEKNIEWALVGLGLIILKIISSRKTKPYLEPPPGSNAKTIFESHPERIAGPINPAKKILILSANPKNIQNSPKVQVSGYLKNSG
jgi:hypothetical protein